MPALSDFSLTSLHGAPMPLTDYAGKVVLIVNVASQCGLTPQYAGLEELQRRYEDRGLVVLGFPCNQFLGQEPGSAEEILQDVMTTLWTKAHLFDPSKSSLATWLYRIARNRRIDTLRRDRLDFFDPMDAPEIPAEDEGADRRIDMQVREDRIRASLEGLPEEQFSLVRMASFDDLSHSEIAEKTGLPLGTVKSRIRLAFTKLRRSLEANGVIDAG